MAGGCLVVGDQCSVWLAYPVLQAHAVPDDGGCCRALECRLGHAHQQAVSGRLAGVEKPLLSTL